MTEAGFRMEVPRGLDALDQAHTIVVLPTLFPERCRPRCSTRCAGPGHAGSV